MTHTPGPWEVYIGGNFLQVWMKGRKEESIYLSRECGAIADIELGNDRNPEKFIADANLIAAAPELLEAGEQLLYQLSINGNVRQAATDLANAIAKAKGE